MNFRVKLPLYILTVYLFAFFVARLALFFAFREDFSALSGGQISSAFLSGLKFDLAAIATLAGIPLLMLSLPFFGKRWAKLWTAAALAELFAMFILLISDIVFFAHVKRHIGDEIRLVANDLGFILDFALKDYLLHLVAASGLLASALILAFRFIDRQGRERKEGPLPAALRVFAVAVFLIMSIRGFTFHGKPINVIDAFGHGSSEYGNLVLNGVFTSYQSVRGSKKGVKHDFLGRGKAVSTAQERVVGEDEILVEPDYPLMRIREEFAAKGEGFNVVVIMLESWSPAFIDSFSGSGRGVTPNFDALAEKGLMFTNFYASGQRSIHGITAALTGLPTIPGAPYLGKGLELANITRLGRVLKDNGYSSVFVQTSKRGSYRMEAIASALGFEEFYGKSDIPLKYPYSTKEEPDFGYDYDGLMFLKDRLDGMKKPFFAFFFSGTTHTPFILLDKKFEKYPHDRTSLNGYLNTLYYADFSLGEFMRGARESGWAENTVFILTSDHAQGQFEKDTLREKFRVPLVIYCPKLFSHKKIGRPGSQADLMPTVIDILNIKAPYAALGSSLLWDRGGRFAFFTEGDNIGIINASGYLKHSLRNRLESGSFGGAFDPAGLEETLLSLDEAVYTLLKENRWHNSAGK